jgi:chromosome segregation ATPase
VQAAKAEKEAQLRGIKAQIAEIDKQIKAAAQKGTSLRTRLKTKQGELERLRNQPDPRKREPKLRREMAAAQERAFTLALEFAQVQASMAEKMAQFAAVDLVRLLRSILLFLISIARWQRRRSLRRRTW